MVKIVTFLSCILLSGCQSTRYIEHYSEPVKEGVYAVNDGIHNGRFDLAQKYSDSLTRLVPAPDNRIKIEPVFESDGKDYVPAK